MISYGIEPASVNEWVIAQRGPRNQRDPRIPYGYFMEEECTSTGEILPVATVLLTNRECPWKCIMCDLWKNTLTTPVAVGDIPAQIDFALDQLPSARHIKLYNSGSFFDPGAIPVEDYAAIAARLRSFERVIVESHPALAGKDMLTFRDALHSQLEVAMGLETAHAEVLGKLNKGMDLPLFSKAAANLRGNAVDLRVFVLATPPFLPLTEAAEWAQRSLHFAFNEGATAASLIPVRSGNGAMELLEQQSLFQPTPLTLLESALAEGIALGRGRVFADLWDLHPDTASCIACFSMRIERLRNMNLTQTIAPAIPCTACGGSA